MLRNVVVLVLGLVTVSSSTHAQKYSTEKTVYGFSSNFFLQAGAIITVKASIALKILYLDFIQLFFSIKMKCLHQW